MLKYSNDHKLYKIPPTVSVEVDRQILQDVHVRGVRDGAHAGSLSLGRDASAGLRADVQHEGVHQGDVALHPGDVRHLSQHIGVSKTRKREQGGEGVKF